MKTNQQLRELIHSALDCPTHFHKPTIVENDPDFKIGEGAIVICGQCVERLYKAIGFEPGDDIGSPHQFRQRERELRK